jgi:ppGpp synthetase/RelA/SpoT-type nucleotidyltranferase
LHDYDNQKGLNRDLGLRTVELIQELLTDKGLRVLSVSYRVKARDSLERKLQRSPERYSSLSDITDLLGVRVITYFQDEVDVVAEIIEHEFGIDQENSIDRRATLEPDRFGYLSLHYIAQIHEKRANLVEYRRFHDCAFELQIRSILQHAWAEMEHDLGYKNEQAIPRLIRRRFSRLASLLEMADEEFAQLRDELQKYSEEVESAIEGQPETVFIDKQSLASFIASSSLVHELDQAIARLGGTKIATETGMEGSQADRYSVHLQMLGLQTIADIEDNLHKYKDLIRRFAGKWFARKSEQRGSFMRGISLFYLMYVLAASTGDTELIDRYLSRAVIEARDDPEPLRRELQTIYEATLSAGR